MAMNADPSAEPDDLNQALDTIHRLQAQLREVSTITAVIAALHGRSVGLGSYQLRIPADLAFEVRSRLPSRHPHVSLSYEDDRSMLITVL
jgi:hypothetical protein